MQLLACTTQVQICEVERNISVWQPLQCISSYTKLYRLLRPISGFNNPSNIVEMSTSRQKLWSASCRNLRWAGDSGNEQCRPSRSATVWSCSHAVLHSAAAAADSTLHGALPSLCKERTGSKNTQRSATTSAKHQGSAACTLEPLCIQDYGDFRLTSQNPLNS